MRRTTLLGTVATLAAAALAWSPTAGAAPSAPAARAADHVEVRAAATSRADHRRIVDYWTPARMRSATPGSRLVAGRPKTSAGGAVDTGEPTTIGPRAKPARPGNGKDQEGTGAYYTGGGQVVSTTGKVFFTLDGTNYVCSGSATTSSNNDVVLTAGHCVHEGPGDYATNWAFVPAYDDGARPYGTFTARSLVTTSQWANSGDFDYDVGFAVMNPVSGQDLTDTVGSQGITFNAPRGELTYAFGYPAARPYDGTDIAYCYDTVFADTYGGSQDQGMDCDMTGGSSGGPWLIDYSTGAGVGTLNSVNSFGYRGLKDVMWGPYFGSVVESAYRTAASM